MRVLALLVALLTAASACGKYGPPVRTEVPKPAPARTDTQKSQDPNAPPAPGQTP